jgi:hypothetical protein
MLQTVHNDIFRGRNTVSNPLSIGFRASIATPAQLNAVTKQPILETKACRELVPGTIAPEATPDLMSSAQLQLIHIDRAISLLKMEHDAIMSNIQRQSNSKGQPTIANLHFDDFDPSLQNSMPSQISNLIPSSVPKYTPVNFCSDLKDSHFGAWSATGGSRKRNFEDCDFQSTCKRISSAR